jgi:hypothetical protein
MLYVFLILLLVISSITIYYALRWAQIIFILEDDLAEAIEVHERTVQTLESLRKTPLFSDSPEAMAAVNEAMENVKVCQTATQKLINNFTQRSKQRYVRLIEDESEED